MKVFNKSRIGVNRKDIKNTTALMLACIRGYETSDEESLRYEIVSYLSINGAKIENYLNKKVD